MAYRRTPAVQARLDAQAGAIVHAAARVLSERGFSGLSMAAVAGEAGVATGTVYKNFSGKTELVTAVFRDVVTREVAAVAAAGAAGPTVGRVTAAVGTLAGRARKNPQQADVVAVAFHRGDRAGRGAGEHSAHRRTGRQQRRRLARRHPH
ncbi:TetR/AcrR family transcriptional regulator, partial [Nocardia wallacei]|uniref:TetR/AcrR family transcriptional regulator n=1 Tax=Nocardia wallacei TaxID=480035 RepID=UPI0024538F06